MLRFRAPHSERVFIPINGIPSEPHHLGRNPQSGPPSESEHGSPAGIGAGGQHGLDHVVGDVELASGIHLPTAADALEGVPVDQAPASRLGENLPPYLQP